MKPPFASTATLQVALPAMAQHCNDSASMQALAGLLAATAAALLQPLPQQSPLAPHAEPFSSQWLSRELLLPVVTSTWR
jgi:hypothetical protein